MAKSKREALAVVRFIQDILVAQLSIPSRQIVNDTTFVKYAGSLRPDLLISEFEYDGKNDEQFVENLVAYAEVKDDCVVNDTNWKDAIKQGKEKSKRFNLPYFIITNCKVSLFYNTINGKEITLNNNPIREFQTIDIFRLIKNRLRKVPTLTNIQTNVDSISTISEAIFNKKLWEIKSIYRGIAFANNVEKIDFTIGFVALEYFEEKERAENKIDKNKIYWSDCADNKPERLVAALSQYISRLEQETTFNEFRDLMEIVQTRIKGEPGKKPLVNHKCTKQIYDIITSMRPLHGCGFDLFGAVYEMFANNNEKREFGEFFTRRHYAHIFAKLLLKDETTFNADRKFRFLDLACGTGGMLTEGFKVLKSNYEASGTYAKEAKKFLEKECFWGVDSRQQNISRTKLNMFLVGDGHTNMAVDNSLKRDFKILYDYILTNPPYGRGVHRAESTSLKTMRMEIAFISKILSLLKIGGRACIIMPDGVLENPSYELFRKELLGKCDITAIISLPIFAFAPYTKEKTYGVFLRMRSEIETKYQSDPIWMYIIDNDGLANSDKRFPTKLRNNMNGWMHDEISGWVSTDGEEMPGILEERWLRYDDSRKGGTAWVDDKWISRKERKAGFIKLAKIKADTYTRILPEHYLRPSESRGSKTKHKSDGKVYAIGKMFDIMQGHQITDEELYRMRGSIPVYTGRNELKGYWDNAIVSKSDLPCVTYPTKGNAGDAYVQTKLFDANNTAVLIPKKKWRKHLNLDWVAMMLKPMFLNIATSKGGVSYLNREIVAVQTIAIPSMRKQKAAVAVMEQQYANNE